MSGRSNKHGKAPEASGYTPLMPDVWSVVCKYVVKCAADSQQCMIAFSVSSASALAAL